MGFKQNSTRTVWFEKVTKLGLVKSLIRALARPHCMLGRTETGSYKQCGGQVWLCPVTAEDTGLKHLPRVHTPRV